MKFLAKLFNFFKKSKNTFEQAEVKIANFIELHKGNIKVLMNVLQVIYEQGKGREKMENVITTVFDAVGAAEYGEKYTDEIADFIEAKCQNIYDELVAEGGLKK